MTNNRQQKKELKKYIKNTEENNKNISEEILKVLSVSIVNSDKFMEKFNRAIGSVNETISIASDIQDHNLNTLIKEIEKQTGIISKSNKNSDAVSDIITELKSVYEEVQAIKVQTSSPIIEAIPSEKTTKVIVESIVEGEEERKKTVERDMSDRKTVTGVVAGSVVKAGQTVADTTFGQTDSDVVNRSYDVSKNVLGKTAEAAGLIGKSKEDQDSENIEKTANDIESMKETQEESAIDIEKTSKNIEELVDLQYKAAEEAREEPRSAQASNQSDKSEGSSGLQNFFGSFLGTLKGGFLSSILGGITASLSTALKGLAGSLLTGLKFLFAPKNILKALTKIALPAAIIGSIVNGIMDGFKTWKETGSISEAIVSGLGGILDFLTFGLIDTESLKSAFGFISEKFDEYVRQPLNAVKEWFSELKMPTFDDLMNNDFVKESLNIVSSIFTAIPKMIYEWVKKIPGVGTLIEKAGGVFDTVKNGAIGVAKTVAEGISSPANASSNVPASRANVSVSAAPKAASTKVSVSSASSAASATPIVPQAMSSQLGSGLKKDSKGITGITAKDKQIMAMIEQHEGKRYKPYKDSLGLWTVGVGHLIGDGKTLPPEMNRTFTEEEIQQMFVKDYMHHKNAAEKIPGYDNLNDNGKAGLIDLTFNMGPTWWKKWPRFTEAVKNGDVSSMVESLRNSKWYTQVGNRAEKVVSLIKNGAGAAIDKVPSMASKATSTISESSSTADTESSSTADATESGTSGIDIGTFKSGLVKMMGLKAGDPSIEAIFSGSTESEKAASYGTSLDPLMQSRKDGIEAFEAAKKSGAFDRIPGIMKTADKNLSTVASDELTNIMYAGPDSKTSVIMEKPMTAEKSAVEPRKAAMLADTMSTSAIKTESTMQKQKEPIIINQAAPAQPVSASSNSTNVTNVYNAPEMDPTIRRLSDHIMYRNKVW